MSIRHHWFVSRDRPLLGHLHLAEAPGGLGVVMVPPSGWEDVCTYRPLRALAGVLAAVGIPVLRFDLPGTGDSAGTAQDENLLDHWIAAVSVAADELRAATGVQDVAVMGVRLGAMIALAAAARGADVQDLILWGPPSSGRGYLRELKIFKNLEVQEFATGEEPPPQPVPGLETAGFLLTPQTEAAIHKLNLAQLPPMAGRRVLLLSRDEVPPDQALQDALAAAGCHITQLPGTGYAGMNAIPQDAEPPADTAHAVREWLLARPEIPCLPVPEPMPMERARVAPGVVETAVELSGDFGVLCEPAMAQAAGGWCVVFLNAGAIRHIGPGRLWVETARRWAARGVPSFRLDLTSIGESDGLDERLPVEMLYREHLVEEVTAAMEMLERRIGARRFILVGLCAGAFWAFHSAVKAERVRSAVLINPRLFFWDPEVDERRNERRSVAALAKGAAWQRVLRGEVGWDRFVKAAAGFVHRLRHPVTVPQIPAEALRAALSVLEQRRTRMLWLFTEGEPLLQELDDEKQMPEWVPCVRFKNAGHTFRPLWAQAELSRLLDQEIAATTQMYATHSYDGGFDLCATTSTSSPLR
jgi:pimeloyl-ACP methyl ester carboxylesterase